MTALWSSEGEERGTDRIVAFTVVGRVIIGTVIRKHGVATLALHAGT